MKDSAAFAIETYFQHNPISRNKGQLKVLEVGWGQGISGRVFATSIPDTKYTVIEPIPEVGENMRQILNGYNATILPGFWEDIVRARIIKKHSQNIIYTDIWDELGNTKNTTERRPSYEDHWPFTDLDARLNLHLLILYQYLSPNGVISCYYDSVNVGNYVFGDDFGTYYFQRMCSTLSVSWTKGLRPYNSTTYAGTERVKGTVNGMLIGCVK